MSGSAPRVSVVMPVYDGARLVRQAIDSLLAQTYGDFELLVVDDGSRDGTAELVEQVRDPRVRLLRRPHGGTSAALNAGLDEARGEYVARLDHDDLAAPTRLAEQVRFMDRHPWIGGSGTWVRTLRARGPAEVWRFPCDPEVLRAGLLFEPGIAHPTAILRRAWLDRCGLRYDPRYVRVEDWDLWRRAAEHFPLANLPRVLVYYRVHDTRTSTLHREEQRRMARLVQGELLRRLGLDRHPLRRVHADVSLAALACRDRDEAFLEDVASWFEVLRRANREHGVYDARALDRFLADRLLLVLHGNRRLRRHALALLLGRGWARRARPAEVLRLLVKTALPVRAQPTPS